MRFEWSLFPRKQSVRSPQEKTRTIRNTLHSKLRDEKQAFGPCIRFISLLLRLLLRSFLDDQLQVTGKKGTIGQNCSGSGRMEPQLPQTLHNCNPLMEDKEPPPFNSGTSSKDPMRNELPWGMCLNPVCTCPFPASRKGVTRNSEGPTPR